MTHSIPDSSARRARTELGTVLITGDYKFDQTPVDGPPPTSRRLAELGREGVALLCGDSTNADRAGFSPSESRRRRRISRRSSRAARAASSSRASPRTSTACSRSSTPPHALDRKVALVGRSMRKNVGIGRTLGHIEIPDGMLVGPREIDDFPDERVVIISTGSQGEPLSALRRMAYRDHPQVELKCGDTRRLLRHARSRATSAPSTRRSTGSTTSAAT